MTDTTIPESESQGEVIRPPKGEEPLLGRAFGGKSALRDIFETILLAVIIFVVINTATGRFQVRGSSMEPNLHHGQYLVVSKLSYLLHAPQRGDVVVFIPPISPDEDYIKRIVGLPGEHVQATGDRILINGTALDEPFIAQEGGYTGEWDVPADSYFVLGDNRGNSSDSHNWGFLPAGSIVGKAWLCYWPPEQWGLVRHHAFDELHNEEE